MNDDTHICWPPIKARNGSHWTCEECGQHWVRADRQWKLTGA